MFRFLHVKYSRNFRTSPYAFEYFHVAGNVKKGHIPK